jgi:hypothetical protein
LSHRFRPSDGPGTLWKHFYSTPKAIAAATGHLGQPRIRSWINKFDPIDGPIRLQAALEEVTTWNGLEEKVVTLWLDEANNYVIRAFLAP